MQKPIIDFQILCSRDPRVLMIADTSMWYHIVNKPAIIEITLPATETKVTKYFVKSAVTTFNSLNLGINCECELDCRCEELQFLDDGAYCIKVTGSPDTFNVSKYHLQTAATRLKLDELYVKANLICSKYSNAELSRIQEAEFLIDAAEANARLDNITEAQELLFRAQDLIDLGCGC